MQNLFDFFDFAVKNSYCLFGKTTGGNKDGYGDTQGAG
jgi:hypothetical protein